MNFFRTLFSLCVSFQNYRPVRDLPVGASVRYLTQLTALLALVLLASLIPLALESSEEAAAWMDQHLPQLSIQNERVVTAVAQPCRVGNNAFLFVLDTTGQVTAPETNAERGVLVMGDRFVMWFQPPNAAPGEVQSRGQSWRGFPDGVVNGDYFRNLVRAFAWVGIPVGYLMLVAGGVVLALLQALFFALVGSFMERATPRPLNLTQHLNIALHAVTPAAIIVTAYLALQLWGLDFWLVYLIAYGVALVGATNACRHQAPAQHSQEDDLL